VAVTTQIKTGVNSLLRRVNLRLDSLTAANAERRRLETLAAVGHFDRPAFPVPAAFARADFRPVLDAAASFSDRFKDFEDPARNDVRYAFDNPYFLSPDAEVLYAFVRTLRPGRIVEVGSGNSTRVARQAIRDGGLGTELISIDPHPRADVRGFADRVIQTPVERAVEDWSVFASIEPGDVLFIDSSHILAAGNDCVALYLQVLPKMPAGVVVHVHDVFLPYEYPRAWVVGHGWPWNEQYLVYAMLAFGTAFDVLWAGHYLQKTLPDFASRFPRARDGQATSLWLRKTV
jgi:hypothetical protein